MDGVIEGQQRDLAWSWELRMQLFTTQLPTWGIPSFAQRFSHSRKLIPANRHASEKLIRLNSFGVSIRRCQSGLLAVRLGNNPLFNCSHSTTVDNISAQDSFLQDRQKDIRPYPPWPVVFDEGGVHLLTDVPERARSISTGGTSFLHPATAPDVTSPR